MARNSSSRVWGRWCIRRWLLSLILWDLPAFSAQFLHNEDVPLALMLFGIANIAVGLIGTAMRQMGKGGMTSKRAALFVMAGALFIVCSIRYRQERVASAPEPAAQVQTLTDKATE